MGQTDILQKVSHFGQICILNFIPSSQKLEDRISTVKRTLTRKVTNLMKNKHLEKEGESFQSRQVSCLCDFFKRYYQIVKVRLIMCDSVSWNVKNKNVIGEV